MKTQTSLTIRTFAVLALLFTSSAAFAFYDPAAQRWISRDPVNEPGVPALISQRSSFNQDEEKNLYGFVRNRPVGLYDPDGRALPVIIGGGIAISTAEAVAASFGLSLAGCLASPACANALKDALRDLLSKCKPRAQKQPQKCPKDEWKDDEGNRFCIYSCPSGSTFIKRGKDCDQEVWEMEIDI